MAQLLYQGHGSYRITTDKGLTVYIDPYAGEHYDVPADIILITHQHGDHNQIQLIHQKPDCRIISNFEALKNNIHQSFKIDDFEIEAVEARNKNHDPKECVGYILTFDGITLYASGDTSFTQQMSSFAARKLDYALLPCDGIYNMNVVEASDCANIIKAKHSIPIHLKPGALFDRQTAEQFDVPGRIIVEPGDCINL